MFRIETWGKDVWFDRRNPILRRRHGKELMVEGVTGHTDKNPNGFEPNHKLLFEPVQYNIGQRY